MTSCGMRLRRRDGIGRQILDGGGGIEQFMHEGRAGPVFQQPPHQIGQQVLIPAARRVHRGLRRAVRQ